MINSEITINKAISSLSVKLIKLDVEGLLISDYNKRYLKDYIDNFDFFMPLYKKLLEKVIYQLSKPIQESCFVDYGGGCGILTFLAVELGFKKVIYNDIYQVSTKDVAIIANKINLKVDEFITGGISQFVSFVKEKNIQIDHICSFDVLEHIYDLEDWFSQVEELPRPFSLCFMTSANSSNPYINRKLKKIHYKAEYLGSKKKKGWKERDANLPFLEIRKRMIAEKYQDLDDAKILLLAKNTRGLYGEDILVYAQEQIEKGTFSNKLEHPTNTCDPYTGNWAEHCIDIKSLGKLIENDKTNVKFTNSFYSYSNKKVFNLPKSIINFTMKILGEQSLLLSPSYTLEIQYKED